MSEEFLRLPQVLAAAGADHLTTVDGARPARLTAGVNFLDSDAEGDDVSGDHKPAVRDAKYYFKVYVLGGVVLLSTVLLMLQPVHDERPNLISVGPKDQKAYAVPVMYDKEKVVVMVTGPFNADGSWAVTESDDKTKYVTIQVQRIFYDAEGKEQKKLIAADSFHAYLMPDTDPERQVPVEISHIFLLYEDAIDNGQYKGKVETNVLLETNADKPVTMKLNLDSHTLDKKKGIFLGAIVLVLLYVLIIWEVVESTFAAVLCATLALGILSTLNPRPSLDEMMAWIDMETLLLLFGMMILVAILSDSGLFDAFAVYAYEISRGHIWPLINSLCLFAAVLSAFLDNVTMMLLASPIIIKLCEALKLDPVAVLTFMVIYANVGAAATPVGDPPNIIITTNRFIANNGINFGNFMMHTIPCITIVMIQTYYQIRCGYSNIDSFRMPPTPEELRQMEAWNKAASKMPGISADERDVRDAMVRKANVLRQSVRPDGTPKSQDAKFEEILASLKSQYFIRDKVLLFKSIAAFAFVIALFFLHSIHDFHHLSLGFCALIGAILLLILADVDDMETMLGRVEWPTLIFFAALFMLMEALSQMGLIELLGGFVVDLVLSVDKEKQLMVALLIILWVSAVASAFLNNIPVTTMMLRIVISLSQNRDLKLPLHPLVWALALGACFGGNGTLLAASANVVSAGIAIQHGYKFTFMRFFRIGFPIMIVNIIVTSMYLIVSHVIFEWHDPVT